MGQALYSCPASNWWERSPNGSNATNFCNVNSNGNANNNNASNSNGVAFGLCNSYGSDVVAPIGVKSIAFTEGELVPGLRAKICPPMKPAGRFLHGGRMCGYSISWLGTTQLEPAPDNKTVRRAILL